MQIPILSFLGLNWVVLAIVAAMLVLRWRKVGTFTWAVAWWLAIYLGVRFGFEVPVPGSVVTMYVAIATGAIVAYVSSDRERWREFIRPPLRVMLEPRLRPLLAVILVALPALAAYGVYADMNVPPVAPAFGRTVHPSPPAKIVVHDTEYDTRTADNPYRELRESNPDEFAAHVESGRRVYFQNCFWCHGDGLGGDGMFAHGLNPIPTNFNDSGVLPILQSSFVFWRIAKGGPGMPEEAGPWDSAMPVWETFLTEEEMWDVNLFLYEFNDFEPRALTAEVTH
ncbi:MAG TPA: cytochrome c [Thermoanaerobaculia bacterium]|nr:cytochrome c [Thermoanaerobaculia bacterium]